MLKVYQTKFHSNTSKGNCIAACVASFFDTGIINIPRFERYLKKNRLTQTLQLFFDSKGYDLIITNILPAELGYKDIYYFVGGRSAKNPSGGHFVVHFNGELFHDPNPEPKGDGIISIDKYFIPVKK
jgi:hypothetical protein